MRWIAAVVAAAGLAAAAAGQAVTPAFTYQGALTNAGQPETGPVDLRFRLYTAAVGGSQVGATLQSLAITPSAGRFSVSLDFGAAAFTPGQRRWLEVDVRPAGGGAFTTLATRQELAAAPFASFATSAGNAATATTATTATSATTAATATNATQLNGQAASFYTNASNMGAGTLPGARLAGAYGSAVTMNNAGNVFAGTFSGDGAGLGGLWRLGGNAGTNPASEYIGTADAQPVNLRANNRRAASWSFAQGTFGGNGDFRTANVLAGSELNSVAPGVSGATIAGGGLDLFNQGSPGRWTNAVGANFGTVGGGSGNQVGSSWGTIAGGNWGSIGASADYGFIGGGNENIIAPAAVYGLIGGGFANLSGATYAMVLGGASNVAYGSASLIGGGNLNSIGQSGNPAIGAFGAVVGGYRNVLAGGYGFIGNGANSTITADYSFIGGGEFHYLSGDHGAVGGGGQNQVLSSYGFVGGGYASTASGRYTVVGGGFNNTASAELATIAGGGQNRASGIWSTVGGGINNTVTSPLGFIGGGARNSVTNATGSGLVVGGEDNNNASDLGVIVGGRQHTASGAENAIVGGRGNTVGGFNSFVGGGYLNSATGSYSVVPGGLQNTAAGDFSFAAGRRAIANAAGAFVLADSQDADLVSNAPNSMYIRMGGGIAVNRAGQLGAGSLTLRSHLSGGYGGMYVESNGASSLPFYGYATDNAIKAWHQYSDGAALAQRVWSLVVSNTTPLVARGDTSVAVLGNLSKAGGSFEIDHPLDPANKYLYHSFVESPDMMNIYNGNVVTDASGYATVVLPEWFEALNREFRYQLTVVDDGEAGGDFVLARVVRKVQDHRFVIKTSAPNTEVSWQVTGVRQDAWAEAHRIPTEVEKEGAERGKYLHPELYGRPAEEGIRAVRPQGEPPQP